MIMKYSESIRSISYLKAHASEIINDISENQKTMIITQNGEAKAIFQDIKEYERTQETLALLKILAIGNEEIKRGEYKPVKTAFKDISKKIIEFKKSGKK